MIFHDFFFILLYFYMKNIMIYIEKYSNPFCQKPLHVLEVLFSGELVLGVSDQFVQLEFAGLLEVVLEDEIALGYALTEEEGLLFLLVLQLLLVQLRK